MGLTDLLIGAGLANSLLLALACGLAARRDRSLAWLCALFCVAFATFAAILATHRTEGVAERPWIVLELLAWAAGPLLYFYIRASLGLAVRFRRAAAHFALPALLLLVGTPLILMRGIEPLPQSWLIAYQIAYSIAAFLFFLKRPERRDRTARGFWRPAAVLFLICGIHLAQLIRYSPLGALNPDVVPLIGSLGVIGLVFLALVLGQQTPAKQTRYAKSSMDEDQARRVFADAEAALRQDGLYRQFDLSLGDVAARVGVSEHHLSQSISTAGGTSFNDLVAGIRVEEARRLLLDPANADVAVEPLGMESGFRSRSAFYAAFRAATGLSPAEYRKRGGSIMSSPPGKDMLPRD